MKDIRETTADEKIQILMKTLNKVNERCREEKLLNERLQNELETASNNDFGDKYDDEIELLLREAERLC